MMLFARRCFHWKLSSCQANLALQSESRTCTPSSRKCHNLKKQMQLIGKHGRPFASSDRWMLPKNTLSTCFFSVYSATTNACDQPTSSACPAPRISSDQRQRHAQHVQTRHLFSSEKKRQSTTHLKLMLNHTRPGKRDNDAKHSTQCAALADTFFHPCSNALNNQATSESENHRRA